MPLELWLFPSLSFFPDVFVAFVRCSFFTLAERLRFLTRGFLMTRAGRLTASLAGPQRPFFSLFYFNLCPSGTPDQLCPSAPSSESSLLAPSVPDSSVGRLQAGALGVRVRRSGSRVWKTQRGQDNLWISSPAQSLSNELDLTSSTYDHRGIYYLLQ